MERKLFKICASAKEVLNERDYKTFLGAKSGRYITIEQKNKVYSHLNDIRIALNLKIGGKSSNIRKYKNCFNVRLLADVGGISVNKMRQFLFENRDSLPIKRKALLEEIERQYWLCLAEMSKINFKSK